MKSKNKFLKVAIVLVMLLSLSGIIYYSSEIITWNLHVSENQKLIDQISEKVEENFDEKVDLESKEIKVDFNSLKAVNDETVAYIKVNNTNIDYIVVKGNDNSFYLNHNFEKKWNVAGWVFADYRNRFDGTDKNIIIYGHNGKDGSMFGTLENVLNSVWYKNPENYFVTLVTEKGNFKYRVFSSYSIIPEDYYISTDFGSKSEFNGFVNVLKSRSVYDYGVEVSGEDNILTLSSCIGVGEKRVVLHAKLVKEEAKVISKNN